MTDRETPSSDELPHYLQPLVQRTPGSIAKLIAAWDGLSTETQIRILDHLEHSDVWTVLCRRVHEKAFESPNGYVRYLAAKHLYSTYEPSPEEEILNKRVAEDPDPLVRYSHMEMNDLQAICDPALRDPTEFFALPQAARLAKVRCLKGQGEEIAGLVRYAVDHGLKGDQASENEHLRSELIVLPTEDVVDHDLKDDHISEVELMEIVIEYIAKPEFEEWYSEGGYDGFAEYLKGKGIGALWGLVPHVPPPVAFVLVRYLPESAGLLTGIPKKVLESMDSTLLAWLLGRQDIGLKELRKSIFLKHISGDESMDALRWGAISHNFDLDYDEFAVVLKKPEKEVADILTPLASVASDLRLCIEQAVHDILAGTKWSKEVDPSCTLWERARDATESIERHLKQLKGWRREHEADEWRLYELAERAVPWKKGEKGYPPSGELEFLAEHVKEGDTWGTFMAFSQAWADNHWEVKRRGLAKILQDSFPLYDEDPQSNLEEDRGVPEPSPLDDEGLADEDQEDQSRARYPTASLGTYPGTAASGLRRPLTHGDLQLIKTELKLWACYAAVGFLFLVGLRALGDIVARLQSAEYKGISSDALMVVLVLIFYWPIHLVYKSIRAQQRGIKEKMAE